MSVRLCVRLSATFVLNVSESKRLGFCLIGSLYESAYGASISGVVDDVTWLWRHTSDVAIFKSRRILKLGLQQVTSDEPCHVRGLAPLAACETELISNWRCLFTSHCMVLLCCTCRTTVNSSRTWETTSQVFRRLYTCHVCRPADSHRLATGSSFSVAGPQLWNNLPTEIRRRGTTFEHYRWLLKAFLFV